MSVIAIIICVNLKTITYDPATLAEGVQLQYRQNGQQKGNQTSNQVLLIMNLVNQCKTLELTFKH